MDAPPAEHSPDPAHGSSHAAGVRDVWRLLNLPYHVEPRAVRIACSIFLAIYGAIAVARYEQSGAFLCLRATVCLYAAFGVWLARRVTWRSIRAYTLGLAVFLPLQAAYIDAMLGNHMPEVGLTALATFCGVVFVQSAIDLAVVLPTLIAGHGIILALAPVPAVPVSIIAMLIGGAIAIGASAGLQTILYRSRWSVSVSRVEDALAASAEWKHRYEAAIVASNQILYDWDPRTDDVRFAGACERMLGYSAAELSGPLARWLTLVHPDDLAGFEREVHRVVAEKAALHMPYRVRRKDGAEVVVESNGQFIFDDAGQTVRMIGFLSDITERTRTEAERAEQGTVSTALARVGRELISSLETPVVLERLCVLTTEVLGCEFSTTWMRKADEGVYSAIASHGLAPEQWEPMRLVRVPAESETGVLAALRREDLVEVHRGDARFAIAARLLAYHGIESALCVALRRGDVLVGMHAAGYRTRAHAFTAGQERIARGIAQLASMALTNATLVEELERAGRLKSEFVSTMSHELRTPLNVILGYADILGDELDGEPRTLLRRIRQSSLELLEMIEATLNLNRLQGGKDPPQIEPLALAALWDDLQIEFETLGRPDGVALRWEPVGELTLETDRRKLKMILKNLVGNALKFTSAGEIVVRCAPAGAETVLSVRDTGIGIPPEHLPHVFEMFRQVDSSDARSYGGAGLGLYIVRQLVTQLGGAIEAESTPGGGSTFRVRLPAAPTAAVASIAAGSIAAA